MDIQIWTHEGVCGQVPVEEVKALGVDFTYYGGSNDIAFHLDRKKIVKTKRLRRGRWERSDNGRWVYYVCPWCTHINKTDRHELETQGQASSLYCSSKKCDRHLFLYFR